MSSNTLILLSSVVATLIGRSRVRCGSLLQQAPSAFRTSSLEHQVHLGGEEALFLGQHLHEASTTLDDDEEDWFRNATLGDVYIEFGCEERDDFPIHSPRVWEQLRLIYHEVVMGDRAASSRGSTPSDGTTSGFVRNITIKHSPGRGRGVFATERISAGSRVWQARETTVRFYSGDDYRRFLAAVPDEYVCDVAQFSYVQDLGQSSYTPSATPIHGASSYETRSLAISVDLEVGAYLNANWDVEENIRFVKDSGRGHFIALRDIEPWEELISDYDDFAVEYGWDIFGL